MNHKEAEMQVRPLHDRVLVQRVEEETKTAGGIIIPDNHTEKPARGKVISVGPGKRGNDGKLIEPSVKSGDVILFGKYSGNEVKIGNEELLIMREEDIFGVIE